MKAYDCCKDALKTAVNGLQEAYVKTVRTIRLNGKDYQTDGNTGIIDLGTVESEPPTASEVSTDDDRNVQVAIDAIEDEIGSETASGSILYKVKANADAISTETTARQNEDAQLASDIADNATAIANETTARTDADNTLQTAIDEINGSISKNASNIASNKTEIEANASAIAAETSNRENADSDLQKQITSNADTIKNETTALYGYINTMQSNIADNTSAIENKQNKLTAGTGIAISDTNEISNTGIIDATALNDVVRIDMDIEYTSTDSQIDTTCYTSSYETIAGVFTPYLIVKPNITSVNRVTNYSCTITADNIRAIFNTWADTILDDSIKNALNGKRIYGYFMLSPGQSSRYQNISDSLSTITIKIQDGTVSLATDFADMTNLITTYYTGRAANTMYARFFIYSIY